MKHAIAFVLMGGLLALVASCERALISPDRGKRGEQLMRYHVVHGWPRLPEGRMLGAVVGVGVDSHDNVFVFHRAGRVWPDDGELDPTPLESNTVLLFDGHSGKVLAEWGANRFAMPHGLTVDQNDNIWLTDVALQQVYQFSHDGRLLMTLGERGVAGEDAFHFNRPTDVAVARDGSFYVSDGYLNTRVMKFSANGTFLFQWGTKGTQPGEFDLPHGLALDAAGHVYVADRSNGRVQIFDASGHYLNEWKSDDLGRPYDLAFSPSGIAFVADGGDQPEFGLDRSRVVMVDPHGAIVGGFGRFGNYDGQFAIAHGIAVAKDGAVYVGDTTGRRVQKFVPDAKQR